LPSSAAALIAFDSDLLSDDSSFDPEATLQDLFAQHLLQLDTVTRGHLRHLARFLTEEMAALSSPVTTLSTLWRQLTLDCGRGGSSAAGASSTPVTSMTEENWQVQGAVHAAAEVAHARYVLARNVYVFLVYIAYSSKAAHVATVEAGGHWANAQHHSTATRAGHGHEDELDSKHGDSAGSSTDVDMTPVRGVTRATRAEQDSVRSSHDLSSQAFAMKCKTEALGVTRLARWLWWITQQSVQPTSLST